MKLGMSYLRVYPTITVAIPTFNHVIMFGDALQMCMYSVYYLLLGTLMRKYVFTLNSFYICIMNIREC
jgi:hypothetical protein